MSDVPDRVRRAFRDSGSFEPSADPGAYRATTTAFEGRVTAHELDDGQTRFDVRVTVPTIDAAAADDVADVVVDGWVETFTRRVVDPGDITRGDHDFVPDVEREGSELVVTASIEDIDPTRGVADARAVIDFVEGTYVQGVIPGYEYESPVADLIASAKRAGGSE